MTKAELEKLNAVQQKKLKKIKKLCEKALTPPDRAQEWFREMARNVLKVASE